MAELCKDEPINGHLLKALSHLDLHLQRKHGDSLDRRDVRDKLFAIGPVTLIRRMAGYAEAVGKTGDRVWAAAIVQEINKGKRTKRIESIIGE